MSGKTASCGSSAYGVRQSPRENLGCARQNNTKAELSGVYASIDLGEYSLLHAEESQ
ncbi:MAG: hypothetical protein H6Q04_247 [Acidobacteria bacterium]|nr:hypothetical protein [Acidobacteriota bacterium]